MTQTQQLLQTVQAKINLYDKQKELSGENFNIFSIMGMESDEVFTHSAIIAELLNPNGSHGLGIKPLELFINQFLNEDFHFSCENAFCIKEEFIGKINDSQTEGGRLDIVVKNNLGEIFVIENKIYAFEQENQLLRYKNKYPNAKLFYLTLNGSTSKQIVNEGDENNQFYATISYEETILNWMEKCVPLAYNKPMVREVMNQYIYLIKKLTNQTTNEKMSEEIIELIHRNLKASEEIFKNFEKVLNSKQAYFLEKIKGKLLHENIGDVIQNVTVEKTDNSTRLKLYLFKDFFITFNFKGNQGLLLIGNSEKQFNLNDDIFSKDFKGFKPRNWDKGAESHYIFWKHKWGDFGNAESLLLSENKQQNGKEENMINELISISTAFTEKFIK